MTTPRDGDAVRFLHSADWQLGMTRRFLGDDAQARYTADRLASVAELAELAVEHDAEFVVVAGDVVTMTGWAEGDGYRVGFGEVTGRVRPAR